MKFIKGMLTGMCISATCMLAYEEYTMGNKKILKQGKKMLKKMGIA